MGREIRTLLPTLEANLKPVLPSQEAITRKDEEAKRAYCQHFNKRHGVRALPDLQPGDSVHVKLDQQKGWKIPGRVVARSATPRSHVIQTPFSVVRRNRRHLPTVNSPGRVEVPDEQQMDLETESQAEDPGSESSHFEPEQPLQIAQPCRVTSAVPFSASEQSSLPQPEVRT